MPPQSFLFKAVIPHVHKGALEALVQLLLDKVATAARAGAGWRVRHVAHIGARAFVHLLVVLGAVQHWVAQVTGLQPRMDHVLLRPHIAGVNAGVLRARRYTLSTRQRRHVDQQIRHEVLLGRRVVHAVAQHHAALRIRVHHLHRLARLHHHNIVVVVRVGADRVLRHAQRHADVGDVVEVSLLRLHAAHHRDEGAEHASGAAHVSLHVRHVRRRLQRKATAVVHDALANHRNILRARSSVRVLVAQSHQVRRVLRTHANSVDAVVALLAQLLALDHSCTHTPRSVVCGTVCDYKAMVSGSHERRVLF
ncbi:metallo-peptidase, clan MF, Family M17 [Leishmania tarentolae]|uniref:Metallo-peptidase, clan MF, Family M17 n=1 Tax=Leishmania tarentolae TaxID=5689 RepID=A0A640KB81_LEITA|nr:metallo-peptidase, clan MF, Family M17 [Leishmania tarentolae]